MSKRTKERNREYMRKWRKANPQYQKNLWKKMVKAQRWYRMERNHGLGQAEWEAKFEAQGLRCAVCSSPEPRGPWWHTDHDHITKALRGILCHKCNLALGHADDSVDVLEKLIAYLKRYV